MCVLILFFPSANSCVVFFTKHILLYRYRGDAQVPYHLAIAIPVKHQTLYTEQRGDGDRGVVWLRKEGKVAIKKVA